MAGFDIVRRIIENAPVELIGLVKPPGPMTCPRVAAYLLDFAR